MENGRHRKVILRFTDLYCAPDFVLDAQSYPIFLVDIFMTSTLQAGVSKRHQKVPNWAIEVLKSSLHCKMKLFPAASPAAAIAANRGITVVCLIYLCSFYRECELFFIHTSIWHDFLCVLILFYQLNLMAFKLKSSQTGEWLWCACFTFVPSIENVSYFSYFNLTSCIFRTFYFVYKYYLWVRCFKIYTIFREIENSSLLRTYLLWNF